MSLSSSLKSFFSSFTAGPSLSHSAARLAERLEALAWYEHSRGHDCCAQQAWTLALEVRAGLWDGWEGGWVAEDEKMGLTKETT